jgi:tripartite-type tricarboxylate transporter receptor subunit TctC
MPDVPTMAEVGFPEGIAPIWNGIVVPAGTSRDVVARLNDAIKGATEAPDVRPKFLAIGIEPVSDTPAQFGELVRKEMAKWAELVMKSGATAD